MSTALTRENKINLFWILSWVYGMTFCFFVANFYSFGVLFSALSIVVVSVLLGPFLGFVSLSVDAYLLQITGRWLGGNADVSSLRAIVAYAKAPSFILLGLWVILLLMAPSGVFIQNISNGSAVAIVFTSLIANVWCFGLLFKHLKTLQGFTIAKTLGNLSLLYVLLTVLYIMSLFICRYLFIQLG